MAKNFKELQAKMATEARARSEAKAQRMIQEMALDELRAARALTQEHLSTLLGRITQFHRLTVDGSRRCVGEEMSS
jgi:hypothetical protein